MNPVSMIRRIGTTIDLLRPVISRGDAGGRIITGTDTMKADIPASVQPASAATIEWYQRRDIVVTHRVYCAEQIDSQQGDTIAIGTRRLVVRGIRDVAGMGHLWEIDCEELPIITPPRTQDPAVIPMPSTPSPSRTLPTVMFLTHAADVIGTGFYDLPGDVYLGDHATWTTCVTKVLQPVSTWLPTLVHITAVSYIVAPVGVWIYVSNKYGFRNAAGLLSSVYPPI